MGSDMLSDFGRTLLDAALRVTPDEAVSWYTDGKDKFNDALPSRIVSNLACCYAGLCLLARVCVVRGLAFDTVFPYSMDTCAQYLEHAARDYLLDGGTNNRSIVEQTFEIMARMRLDPKVYYKIEGGKLYLWLTPIYDLYTKYRKDYAIVGEVLTYAQFKKQLQHSEYFLASNQQKFIGTDKGTIEFRLFQFDAPADGKQNGLHAGQLKSYMQLCLALSQMAKMVKTASPKPQQVENPKYAMRTWLLRLGFIGEEFATARDILTRNLAGDAAFRHGRPA